MSAYEYLTVNSLTAYPFRDGRGTNSIFPLDPEIFLDILFVIYNPSIKRPYIKVINPEEDGISIDFHDVDGDLKIFTVAIPSTELVSHYKNFDKPFFGYKPAEYYPKASVKLVFGSGVSRLLELTEAVTFSPGESEISPSAVQYSVPEVSTVLFESWLPDFDTPGYNPLEGQSVYPIKTYMREEDVYMRYGHNNTFNYLAPRTMYLDVIKGSGLGLYDPCPTVPPNDVITTINRIEPDPSGNMYFKVSDCHALRLLTDEERQSALDRILAGGKDYANFQIDHYLKFWDTGNIQNYNETYTGGKTYNTLDTDFINHGFVLENYCKPKCPHENLNAFAQYLNRVKDGVSELYKIVENSSETCGWAIIEGNVLTATSFCQDLPTGNSAWQEAVNCNSGFLKYFHEGRKIKIRKDSSTTYNAEIVEVIQSQSGLNTQVVLKEYLPELSSGNYLFKVADFGLLNKLNFEIAKHNNSLVATNNAYADFNYSTVEAFNTEQKYVTFITTVSIIYNPSPTQLSFTVTYGLNSNTTLILSSVKVKYPDGTIVYANTNSPSGIVLCKKYAIVEAIFQVPCGGIEGDVTISVIDNATQQDLEASPKQITITSADCVNVNVDTLRRSSYENVFYGFNLSEELVGIAEEDIISLTFSNKPTWLTASQNPIGDEVEGSRYQLYGTPTIENVGQNPTENKDYSIGITINTTEGVFLTTLFLSYIARPRITYPSNGDIIEIRPPDTLNRNYTLGSPLIRIDATNSPTVYRFDWADGVAIPGFGWSDNKLIGKYGYDPNQTYPLSYTVTLTARNEASPQIETGDLSVTVTILVSNLSNVIDPPAIQDEAFCYAIPNPNNATLSLISTLPEWLSFKLNLEDTPQGCNIYGLNTSEVSILERFVIRYDYGNKFENTEFQLPYVADPVITYPPQPQFGQDPLIIELGPPDYSSSTGSILYTSTNPIIKIIATNNPTSFQATGLHEGLTIDTFGNVVGQIPPGVQPENNTVTVTATNAAGSSQRSFILRLTNIEEKITVLENSNFCYKFSDLANACRDFGCWTVNWENQETPPLWLHINTRNTAACHFENSARPTDPLSKQRRFTLRYKKLATDTITVNSNYILDYIAKPRILVPAANEIFTIATQNLQSVNYTSQNPLFTLDVLNTTPTTTYEITGLPNGLSLVDGKIIGSFQNTTNLIGEYLVVLNVTNLAGTTTAKFKIVISNNTTQKAYQLIPYCYKITGLSGAASYDYEVVGSENPFTDGWLNFDSSISANCNLFGTPGSSLTQNKTYDLLLKAIRADGNIVTQAFRLNYIAKPEITYPEADQTFTLAPPDYNSFLFTTTSPIFKVEATNSPTSFYATGFSPGTLKITRNGELVGVSGATVDPNIPVQIYAVNEAGESAPVTVNFAVTNTVKTIAFNSTVNTPCDVGATYKFETDLDKPEEITLSGQPAWITFDNSPETDCNLTFGLNKPTLTESQNIPLILTRKYRNGLNSQGNQLYGSIRERFNLLITAPPVIVSPTTAQDIRYVISQPDYNNRVYTTTQPLATVRATNNPTSITATGLPPGLQIVQSGENIGKIISIGNSKVSQIGLFTVTATATNPAGLSNSAIFKIEVKNEVLQIAIKEGVAIQNYSCKLTTLDGATSYSIVLGTLPNGLSFSGSPSSSCNFLGVPAAGNPEQSRIEVSSNYDGGSSVFAVEFLNTNKPIIIKFTRNGSDVVNDVLNLAPLSFVDIEFTEAAPLFEVVTTGSPSSFYAEGFPSASSLTISCEGKVVGTIPNTVSGVFPVKIIAVNEAGQSASRTITLGLSKITPVITWNNPSQITYGTELNITDHLNATVNAPGNLTYVPPAGTRLNASDQPRVLTVYFTPQDLVTYALVDASVTIRVNKATPIITWNNPAPISYYTQLGSTQLNASANIDGTFSYNPILGSRLNAGTYTISCIFTPTDVTNYTTATKDVTLVVNKITVTPQNIYWSNPANIEYGTALTATQLNAIARISATDQSSPAIPSNSLSYVYDPPLGTVLSAGSRTLKVTFVSSDSLNFTSTPVEKTVTIQVNLKSIPISWANPANIVYGTALSGTQLNATSTLQGATFVYNPPAGTVLNAGSNQTLSVTVTGDSNYSPTTITRVITVEKANSSITITSTSSGKVGETITLAATPTGSTGALTFSSSSSSILSITNSNQANLLRAGTVTITANLAGDSNYNSTSRGQTIIIAKGDSALSITSNNSVKVGESLTVAVSRSGSNSAISLSSSNTAIFGLSGNTLTGITAGTATLTASVTSDQNYNAASTTQVITVTKGNSTLSITSANSGIETNTLTLTSSKTGSTGTVTFTSSNTAVVSISGTTATLVAPGTAIITATLATDANYLGTTTTQIFTVTAKSASSVVYVGATTGFVGDFLQMPVITSGSTGNVTYTSNNTQIATVVGSSTLNLVGAGTAAITITLAGDNNFKSATTSFTITASKRESTINLIGATTLQFGGTYILGVEYTGSNGAITYSSSDTSVATISSSRVVTILNVGTVTFTATLAANAQYNSATTTLTLTVSKGNSTLTITAPLTATVGETNKAITFTRTGSQGALTFSAPISAGITVDTSNNTLSFSKAGIQAFTGSLTGDNLYNGITATRSVSVAKRQVVMTLEYRLNGSSWTSTPPQFVAFNDLLSVRPVLSVQGSAGTISYSASPASNVSSVDFCTVTQTVIGVCQVNLLILENTTTAQIITFSLAEDANYTSATATASIAIGGSATFDPNYNIKVIGSGTTSYTINGVDVNGVKTNLTNPTLTVYSNSRVRFQVNTSGNPFYIKTANTTGTGNLATGVWNNGDDVGTVDWTVPSVSSSTTYYYQSSLHAGMSGQITVLPLAFADSTRPLFDTSSFNNYPGGIPQPYLGYINQAIARWSTYIQFNPDIYDEIRTNYINNGNGTFNGIRLSQQSTGSSTDGFYLYTDNASSTVASCGIDAYWNIGNFDDIRFNTDTISIQINERWQNLLTAAEWVDVLTHELGHGLGIGIFWKFPWTSYGGVAPINNFLSGTVYTNSREGYKRVINNGNNYTKVPVEDTGGTGTGGSHWEDTFRPTTYIGAETGFSYPGLDNELMVGYVKYGGVMRISALTIGALKDFGYEEINPGRNEGLINFSAGSVAISTSSTTTQEKLHKCCGAYCEHNEEHPSECLGTLQIE